MLIIVIITGIITGWVVGNFILDKWVNEGNEDINEQE